MHVFYSISLCEMKKQAATEALETSSQYESLMAVTCNYTVKFNRDALNKCGSVSNGV